MLGCIFRECMRYIPVNCLKWEMFIGFYFAAATSYIFLIFRLFQVEKLTEKD